MVRSMGRIERKPFGVREAGLCDNIETLYAP
nr:MAG TPA: hypothetical protein [Caudoviricetes sp.]